LVGISDCLKNFADMIAAIKRAMRPRVKTKLRRLPFWYAASPAL
jgi:hypothetical protein